MPACAGVIVLTLALLDAFRCWTSRQSLVTELDMIVVEVSL